jgi:hypothetical protein
VGKSSNLKLSTMGMHRSLAKQDKVFITELITHGLPDHPAFNFLRSSVTEPEDSTVINKFQNYNLRHKSSKLKFMFV